MQYISPFSLLEAVGINQISNIDLSFARKKLLTELELDGGITMVIKDRELTKNDILILIDSLREEEQKYYHQVIANDVVLRNFLENSILEDDCNFMQSSVLNNPQFIDWLSPYYFTSFSKLSVECISLKLSEKWRSLLSNPLLMNAVWAEKAWGIIEELVQKNLRVLKSFINKKRWKAKDELELPIDAVYIPMLQILPDERFSSLKDEYAYFIMKCAIHIYNTKNKQTALLVISRALSLAVSDELQKDIENTRFGLLRHFSAWQKGGQDRLARKIAWSGVLIVIIYTFWKSCTEPSAYYYEQNDNDSALYKQSPAKPGKTLHIADTLKSASLTHKTK